MSDRLRELHRQRALLQDHLAWLEREIKEADGTSQPNAAATQPHTATAQSPSPPSASTMGLSVITPGPTATGSVADAILDKYRVKPTSVQQDVRKGCFLYFTLGFILFVLGVLGLYYALRST